MSTSRVTAPPKKSFKRHKICFIGGPQTGKTMFSKHLESGITEDFKVPTPLDLDTCRASTISQYGASKPVYIGVDGRYTPTVGVEVRDVEWDQTTKVSIWDCAGMERYSGLADGYYIGSVGALAFGGRTDPRTARMVKNFTFTCTRWKKGSAPVVFVEDYDSYEEAFNALMDLISKK